MKNLFCLFFLMFFSGSLFAEDAFLPEYAECKLSFLSMIFFRRESDNRRIVGSGGIDYAGKERRVCAYGDGD